MRLEQLDFANICRADDCVRLSAHNLGGYGCTAGRGGRHHEVVELDVLVDGPTAGSLLHQLTYAAVNHRIGRTFTAIYRDVLDDYGKVTERSVYRAVSALRDERKIALVVPRGMRTVAHREGLQGVYVRYDSPLLWQPDGLAEIMAYAEDCRVGC